MKWIGRKLKRYDSGVTIIDVVIAVMIVAIIGLIGTVSLQNLLAGFRVRTATRTLMTNLHMARMKAITRNTFYAVALNPAGSYQIQQLDGGWTPDGALMTLPTGVSFYREGDSAITFANPANMAIFGPTGAAVDTGNFGHNGSIFLKGLKDDQRYRITIFGMGGRIRMSKGWN